MYTLHCSCWFNMRLNKVLIIKPVWSLEAGQVSKESMSLLQINESLRVERKSGQVNMGTLSFEQEFD